MRPPSESVLGVPVVVRRHPLVPEIPLHLASDGIVLRDHVREIQDAEHIPCWAFAWAAGALLARVILDAPEQVRGRDVVDFGAGSGIVAIAAAMAGARSVHAIDRDPDARVACTANAALAGVVVHVRDEMPATYDVLCAADVLYASENARVLAGFARDGLTLMLADAFRDGREVRDVHGEIVREVSTFPDIDVPVHRATLVVIDSEKQFRALESLI